MGKLSNFIKQHDAFNVKRYILERLKRGTMFKFQLKRVLDKIENSEIRKDVFEPYIECDIIKDNKYEWDKEYLNDLYIESMATSKFDKEFVLHIGDVSGYVYKKQHIAMAVGVGLACAAAAAVLFTALRK